MACKYPESSRSYRCCILCKDNNFCSDSTFNSSYGATLETTLDNNILPSASDAKKLTEEYINQCLTKDLKEISEKIKEAIANGKFAISGNGCLQKETKQRLEELGYKVTYGTQYNESYWNISWR